MQFLYSYVKNICVFTLVITLILNIFPDQSYKKYIKLFAGLLLLAIIFNPIVKQKKTKLDIEKVMKQYTHGSYEIDFKGELDDLENKIYERISDEYKTNN